MCIVLKTFKYKRFAKKFKFTFLVWWYTYAPAVKTFLAQYKLAGKTILPFATNGGWLGHTFQDIAQMCSGAKVQSGLNIHFDSDRLVTPEADILRWIKKIS